MTVIRPNSISGVTSITALTQSIEFYKSDGSLSGANIDGISINTAGIITANTFYGNGSNITNLNASNIASGTVAPARLGSGTANSSTFLAGDSTFKTVTGTTINNNANNRLITGSGTANTLEGESSLTYDALELHVNNASPKLKLTDTDNGGIFHLKNVGGVGILTTTDAMIFETGNNASPERLRITPDGKIGVNNNSPTAKLHVSDSSFHLARFTRSGGQAGVTIEGNHATEAVYLSLKTLNNTANSGCVIEGVDASGNGTSWIKLFTENDSTNAGAISLHTRPAGGSTTERLRITSGGFVGINETSPDNALHVKSTTDTQQIKLENTVSTGRAQIRYLNPQADWQQGIIGGTTDGDFITYTSSAKNIRFYTNNSERLRIASNGQIQHYAGGGDNQFISKRTGTTYSNGDYYFYLFAQNNGGTNVGSIGIVRDSGNDDSRIIFSTATGGTNAEKLRINQYGAIGVGGANYGSSGQVLKSQGSGSAVQWATPSGILQTVYQIKGGFETEATNSNSSSTPESIIDGCQAQIQVTNASSKILVHYSGFTFYSQRYGPSTAYIDIAFADSSSSGVNFSSSNYSALGTDGVGAHRKSKSPTSSDWYRGESGPGSVRVLHTHGKAVGRYLYYTIRARQTYSSSNSPGYTFNGGSGYFTVTLQEIL